MNSSSSDALPENPIAADLDLEIASLRAQVESLKSQRQLHASVILSSQKNQSILSHLVASQKPTPTISQIETQPNESPLLTSITAQKAHNQQNLYRACAGVTTFKVRDPDPNAVDNGNILSIRFDLSSRGKFIRPYFIHLNKPWPNSELLRVHRHTVPISIPLESLASKYLPHGKGAIAMSSKEMGKRQDLRKFVRGVRKELAGYHNRISVFKNLRQEFRLDEKVSKKGKGKEKVIVDIRTVDAEAKQLHIEFVDGRTGRVVVDERGEVVLCVVTNGGVRDGETERRIISASMEQVGERLREGIY